MKSDKLTDTISSVDSNTPKRNRRYIIFTLFFIFITCLLFTACEASSSATDIAVVPRWDQMHITRKYSSLLMDDVSWEIRNLALDKTLVGDEIRTETTEGYDIYEKKKYTTTCTLYKIKKVSEKCALAARFEGTDEYYPCVNGSNYKPATLGDMIDDLNLQENLVFNKIYIDDVPGYFEIPDSSVIWDMLLSDTSAKNRGGKYYKMPVAGISVDVAVIGAENISLAVNKQGYLQTNIMGTGKSFYLGKDKVQEFIDYVAENCKHIVK